MNANGDMMIIRRDPNRALVDGWNRPKNTEKGHRGELGFEPRASRIYSQRPGKPEARIIPLDHTPNE